LHNIKIILLLFFVLCFFRIRSSLENLVDDPEPVVTFPDENKVNELHNELTTDENLENTRLSSVDRMKYEEKRTMNTSKTKFLSNGFSSEQVNKFL
jgi:hypothetical protein